MNGWTEGAASVLVKRLKRTLGWVTMKVPVGGGKESESRSRGQGGSQTGEAWASMGGRGSGGQVGPDEMPEVRHLWVSLAGKEIQGQSKSRLWRCACLGR